MEWSEADARIFNDVQNRGWHVMIVADQPAFAYTIGLFARYRQPEMVVFGLAHKVLHTLCNDYGEQVKAVQTLTPERYILDRNAVLRSVDPAHMDDYFGRAQWFYRHQPFPAVQLIWTDPHGRYPWDEVCDPFVRESQPLLTE